LALLHRALPRQLLCLDHRCVAVEQSEHDAKLVFASRTGGTTSVTADVVVGADGIHSVVRQAIASNVVARFSGMCAFRCLVPAEMAPEIRGKEIYLAPKGGVVGVPHICFGGW